MIRPTNPPQVTSTRSANVGGEPVSPYQDLIGHSVVRWEPGEAELHLPVGPEHLNRSGVVHGGVLLSLHDSVGGFAGCHCTVPGNRRNCVTITLNATFHAPAQSGVLVCTGRVQPGGRQIFSTWSEIRDASGTLISTATAVFKYRKGSETPEGMPR